MVKLRLACRTSADNQGCSPEGEVSSSVAYTPWCGPSFILRISRSPVFYHRELRVGRKLVLHEGQEKFSHIQCYVVPVHF